MCVQLWNTITKMETMNNIKSFEKFFHKTLLETPMNTGEFESEYSDTLIAMGKYTDVMNNLDKKLVFTLYPDTHPVYLYEEKDGNDVVVCFVPKNDKFIYGYVSYEETQDNGAIMSGVYNRPEYLGLAQGVYNRYLIPKYDYIMSSGRHSPMGQSFWGKIIKANFDKRVEIWDIEKGEGILKINNIDDVSNFYGNGEDYERYRIKISKL